MKNPKVTVLMSVYNGEKYLNEAIDSILGQTFKDFEFLIVNDGSTDKTAEILKSYKDPRIKIINNNKNIGLTKSLNKGLKLARGEYIARQDADDISMPERLEKELKFMEIQQNYAAVGTFSKIINEKSEVISLNHNPGEYTQIQEFFKKDNCITHGSVMIRESCLQEIGLFNESMARSQDFELWLRLSKKYYLANIPEYLYKLRKHKNSIETKYISEQKIFVVLAMVEHDILNIKEATSQFINLIAKIKSLKSHNSLFLIFAFIKYISFNKVMPFTFYKLFYRIFHFTKIKSILTKFKLNEIAFTDAELSLKKIVKVK